MKTHLRSYRTLHVRSLNYLQVQHTFTYFGARILAEGLHDEAIEEWTETYLRRKTLTNRRQVYWKYSLFKGMRGGQPREYRKCIVGSPSTQLAEVWMLALLSLDPAFSRPSSVYSYPWSGSGSGHVFEHFLPGYRKRERAIAEAARCVDQPYVLVFDLKQFYPSVDKALALKRFKQRLERSKLGPEREAAYSFAEQLLSVPNVLGIPVGPPLSHIVSDVYLEKLDDELGMRFPGRYFRYVDDIAIVTSLSQVEQTKEFVQRAVENEGLQLNMEKTDEVNGEVWTARVDTRSSEFAGNGFDTLMQRIRINLAYNPDLYDELRKLLMSEGFLLPMGRLRAVASYSRYRRFLQGLLRTAGVARLLGLNLDTPKTIVDHAKALRCAFLDRVGKLTECPTPTRGMAHRWALQDLRFAFNRLLYLIPGDSLADVARSIPPDHELATTRVVFDSLATGDATALLDFPGPTVAAFAQLWAEKGGQQAVVRWPDELRFQHRDSAVTLAALGVCRLPEGVVLQLKSIGSQRMTNLAAGRIPLRRGSDDFSYIDEMESLFLTPGFDRSRATETRYDEGEDVYLPALGLGGQTYS